MLLNIVSICNILVLLPLFLTVENSEAETSSILEKMTLINAKGQYYRVWVVFFFTVAYSMMGHMLVYFFEEKR